MKEKLYTKSGSLLLVVLVYTIAFFIATVIFWSFKSKGVLIATLLADITATLIVWGMGLIFKNASLYDPYWSIVPVLVIPFWVIIKSSSAGVLDIFLIIAVTIWGIRLTLNWVVGWKGLSQQDWRYTMLKEKNPDIWFITNLGGINMMPTIFVFLGMIPAYYMINSSQKINVINVIGFLICIFAAIIQFIADRQMAIFRSNKENNGKCINTGLWKYSRHPNYLGEISLWWGIWIMLMGNAPDYWITVIGPIAMTFLFVFISIPMMEKYVLQKRPNYADYKKTVPMLIPRLKNPR
ncbi:MAG: DUF1295 domain-containing protein [Clostridiales bacterium]|nr:DUF1295 domain-containing protein [Clostridiales bacterium]